jgi:3-oxoacyl-[acyl-carrier protein] reductase
MRFSDRVVVITGSSRNIGATTARRFAAEGAKVVLNAATSAVELQTTAAAMTADGYNVRAVLADVATEDGSNLLIAEAVRAFGRLDVLVINHSVRPRLAFADMSPDDWHEVIGINLHSAFYLCRAAVPHLAATRKGSIIALGSASHRVIANARAHAFAGLAGRNAFLRTIAHELTPQGVRVNFIEPGVMDTVRKNLEWYPGAPPEGPQWAPEILAQIPMGRPGSTDELASAILFLASDEASYIVGATLEVTGGWKASA